MPKPPHSQLITTARPRAFQVKKNGAAQCQHVDERHPNHDGPIEAVFPGMRSSIAFVASMRTGSTSSVDDRSGAAPTEIQTSYRNR